MDVKIRKANLSDLKTVQDLNHDLFISDRKSDDQLNIEWPLEEDGEKYFLAKISGESGVCFVAERQGKVIGYLAGYVKNTYSYRPVKTAEIDNMIVREGERSKGTGAKLVEAFLSWCMDEKVKRVIVIAYSPNLRAIDFYKKVGFRPLELELEQEL